MIVFLVVSRPGSFTISPVRERTTSTMREPGRTACTPASTSVSTPRNNRTTIMPSNQRRQQHPVNNSTRHHCSISRCFPCKANNNINNRSNRNNPDAINPDINRAVQNRTKNHLPSKLTCLVSPFVILIFCQWSRFLINHFLAPRLNPLKLPK